MEENVKTPISEEMENTPPIDNEEPIDAVKDDIIIDETVDSAVATKKLSVMGALKIFFVDWIYTAFWKTFVVKKLKFDKWKGWIYLSPAIVLLLIFTIWPIFNTVNMAFMNGYTASGKISGDYVVTYGIENFKMAVKELTGFPLALKNTLLLTFVRSLGMVTYAIIRPPS